MDIQTDGKADGQTDIEVEIVIWIKKQHSYILMTTFLHDHVENSQFHTLSKEGSTFRFLTPLKSGQDVMV